MASFYSGASAGPDSKASGPGATARSEARPRTATTWLFRSPVWCYEGFQTPASQPWRVREEAICVGERKEHVLTQEAGRCLESKVGGWDTKDTPAVHVVTLSSHRPAPGSSSLVGQPPPELLLAAQGGAGSGKP